jgi:hypothetical protein
MTRLTNAFSKKVENHAHAMALHFLYYNFVRIHMTLRTTPAMAACVTKRLWEMSDIVNVLEAWEAANRHFCLDSQGDAVLHSEKMREGHMARADASGFRVSAADIPIIIGMINRGDRRHDIAAWFGLNQGRIKNTQDGKYGPPHTTAGLTLPPKGPPGIKGRLLREAIDSALDRLNSGDIAGGIEALQNAVGDYDADEV